MNKLKDFLRDIFDMTWDDFKFWIVVYFLLLVAGCLTGYYIAEFVEYTTLF